MDFYEVNHFSSPFQSPQYYHLLKPYENIDVKVFAILISEKISALAVVNILKVKGIQSFFSRRAIIYGGPLIEKSEEGKEALSVLLKGIASYLRGRAIYCEIRNSFDYSRFKKVFTKNGWSLTPHLNIRIDIDYKTEDEVLKEMHPARRREIRLSMEAGAIVKQTTVENEIRTLYEMLHVLYKNRVKLPLPDFNYFRELFLRPPGITFVTVHEGKIIGGVFCLYSPGHSLYTPYYAGIRSNKIFPTALALHGAIQFAIQNGIKVIDLMGAGKPGIPYGVRDFKMEFGGELLETGRYIKILNPVLYYIGKTGISLLKKLR